MSKTNSTYSVPCVFQPEFEEHLFTLFLHLKKYFCNPDDLSLSDCLDILCELDINYLESYNSFPLHIK